MAGWLAEIWRTTAGRFMDWRPEDRLRLVHTMPAAGPDHAAALADVDAVCNGDDTGHARAFGIPEPDRVDLYRAFGLRSLSRGDVVVLIADDDEDRRRHGYACAAAGGWTRLADKEIPSLRVILDEQVLRFSVPTAMDDGTAERLREQITAVVATLVDHLRAELAEHHHPASTSTTSPDLRAAAMGRQPGAAHRIHRPRRAARPLAGHMRSQRAPGRRRFWPAAWWPSRATLQGAPGDEFGNEEPALRAGTDPDRTRLPRCKVAPGKDRRCAPEATRPATTLPRPLARRRLRPGPPRLVQHPTTQEEPVKNAVILTAKLITEPTIGALKDGTGNWARARASFWNSGTRQGYISLITFDPGVAELFTSLTIGCVVELRGELDYNQWTDRNNQRRSEVQLRVFDLTLEQRPSVATRTRTTRPSDAS